MYYIIVINYNTIKDKSHKLAEDKTVAVKTVILNLFPIEYESKDVIKQHDEVKNFYKDLKNLFISAFKIFISINETFVNVNSSFFILN